MPPHASPSRIITRVQQQPRDEVDQRPLDLALLRRLLGYLKPYRPMRNWLTFLVIIRAIQLPLLAWSTGAVINGPISRGDLHGTILGALGFGLLALLTQVTLCYRQRLGLLIGERVMHDIRMQLFQHILSMPVAFFGRMKLGRIISRMATDVDAVRAGVQDVLFVGCVQGGQSLVSAVLMWWIDWRLFLVVMLMAPIVWWLNHLFQSRISHASRALQESFSRITATLAESVNGIRVTQGFARESVNADLFQELALDHSRFNVAFARASGLFLPLLEFSSQVVSAILIFAGGILVLRDSDPVPIGTLIQFLFLSGIFFSGVQGLGNLYNNAMTAMAGAERVFRLLDMPPDWSDPADARVLPPISGHIECLHLTFGYDPAKPILHDIHVSIHPGQTIALVGHTASGKTTLVNLIAKFYLPSAGDIRIDGIPIRSIASESLHSQMAIIHQQNFLFTGSIADNIRLGRPGASDEAVRDAARRLDCLDILESLPEGLETMVGERGTGISMGQRQLVCFVRALLADPRILILDEAASALDPDSETIFMQNLARIAAGKTVVIISHRLSTLVNADKILVFERGHLIDAGPHPDLLTRCDVYAHLWHQQTSHL